MERGRAAVRCLNWALAAGAVKVKSSQIILQAWWSERQLTPHALEAVGWTRTTDSGVTSMHLNIPNGPALTANFIGQTFTSLVATMSAPVLDADGLEQEDPYEIDFPGVSTLEHVLDVAARLTSKVVLE